MAVSFSHMNPLSRVWVFQSNRLLNITEQEEINTKLGSFIAGWQTHGTALYGSFEIKNNCSVIVAVDEKVQSASGCSISSLTALFESLGAAFNLSFFDRFSIAYKVDDKVSLSSVKEFKALIAAGVVNADTVVFNNLIANKEDLSTKWELPLKDSWQKRNL